jgi:hypothetical protein
VARPKPRALAERYRKVRERALDPRTQPISEWLRRSPRMLRLGLGEPLIFLTQHWGVFAGPALGAVTRPVSLRNGELKVQAASPLLRQELTYAAPHIMAVAADHFGPGVVAAIKSVA